MSTNASERGTCAVCRYFVPSKYGPTEPGVCWSPLARKLHHGDDTATLRIRHFRTCPHHTTAPSAGRTDDGSTDD